MTTRTLTRGRVELARRVPAFSSIECDCGWTSGAGNARDAMDKLLAHQRDDCPQTQLARDAGVMRGPVASEVDPSLPVATDDGAQPSAPSGRRVEWTVRRAAATGGDPT